MAYQEESFNGVNDALDKLRAFLVAEGWTVNMWADDDSKYGGATFTGKRLHVVKDGVYANFRSTDDQKVMEYEGSYTQSGIVMNLSTGYNALNEWDKQPGHTASDPVTGDSIGGVVRFPNTQTGGCYFFSNATCIHAVYETGYGYRSTSFGKTSKGFAFYACSGAYAPTGSETYEVYSSACLRLPNYRSSSYGYGSSALLFSGDWYIYGHNHTIPNNELSLAPLQGYASSGDFMSTLYVRGFAARYTVGSPDEVSGNAPLVTVELLSYNEADGGESFSYLATGPFRSAGTVEGLYWINMSQLVDGQEFDVQPGRYKVFHQYPGFDVGFAFYKGLAT